MKDLLKLIKTFERKTGVAIVTTIYGDGSGEVAVWEDPSERLDEGAVVFEFNSYDKEGDFYENLKAKQRELRKEKI
jgi:hypothetical protein